MQIKPQLPISPFAPKSREWQPWLLSITFVGLLLWLANSLPANPLNPQLSPNRQPITTDLLTTNSLIPLITTPPPTCSGLSQEAENGTLSGTFSLGNDPLASGGKYVHTPNGSGNYYNGPVATQKADYCFNVTITGTYYLRIAAFAADTLDDSFYVQVDNAPATGYLWDIFPIASYGNDYVNDRFIADPVELQLTAGQHFVTIYPREDGARLDRLELQPATPDSSLIPTCAGLAQEAESGVLRGAFVVENDPLASGGKYIHTPKGSGSYWYGPDTQEIAKYCFNLPTQGIYRIDAAVYGADDLSDSFYMRLNNAPTTAYLWDALPNTRYLTDSVSNRSLADPVLLKLPSGQHTITLYAREDGTRLDTLQLVFTGSYSESTEPPLLAQAVFGTVRLDAGELTDEIDFSQIYLALRDKATQGQKYTQRVQADRVGHFRFEEMVAGQYIVAIELPAIYTTKMEEVAVTASIEQAVEVLFDIEVVPNQKVYLPLINR